jgi:hypothetical protein
MLQQQYRFDLLFSYWIVLWFFLFVFGFTRFNPLFALILAFFENMINLVVFYCYDFSLYDIFLFFVITIFNKGLPILYIYLKHEFKIKETDITFTFILFFCYIGWLLFNGFNFDHVTNIYENLKVKKYDGPLSNLVKEYILTPFFETRAVFTSSF